MQEMTVSKAGELLLQTQIVRNKFGIQVTIHAAQAIEDMMAMLTPDGATPRSVTEFHRYWKGDKDLMVYGLPGDLGGLKGVSPKLAYRLDRPGQALDLPDDRLGGMAVVNLSFLRLVGASNGVSFTVNQVYSRDGVADLCKKIEEATRNFYIQYLKPVDMRIMVMTQALS